IQGTHSKRMASPFRLPILYLILGVLILVSVVPLYFYATQVVAINREQLKTQEQVLQNTITGSLAEDISQRQNNLRTTLSNLASAILVTSGSNLAGDHVSAPELRALLEKFVTSSPDVAYATIVNEEMKGPSAGKIGLDDFTRIELQHAFSAARDGRPYNSKALEVNTGKGQQIVMIVSTPLMADGRFIGMIATMVDLNFLNKRLNDASTGGLAAFVVDSRGGLVAGAPDGSQRYAVGRDMT